MVPVLALAGALAAKEVVPVSAGTFVLAPQEAFMTAQPGEPAASTPALVLECPDLATSAAHRAESSDRVTGC